MDTQQTITKKHLVDRIAERTGTKRVVVKRIVQSFLDEIIEELGVGNRLEFRDFGVFEIRERAARTAQNPKTMEKVPVPKKRTVKFKVGRLMKERLGDTDGEAETAAKRPAARAEAVRHDGPRHNGAGSVKPASTPHLPTPSTIPFPGAAAQSG